MMKTYLIALVSFFSLVGVLFGAPTPPFSPHLRSLKRRPQAPHAKSKFLATEGLGEVRKHFKK